jgi:hypothetical protein
MLSVDGGRLGIFPAALRSGRAIDMSAIVSVWSSLVQAVQRSRYGPWLVVAGIVAVTAAGYVIVSIAIALCPPVHDVLDALLSLTEG